MNMREEAPLNTLLSLGRKLNISLLLASQRFSDGEDDLGRLEGYCDTKVFGRPMDGCLTAVSKATGLSVENLLELEDGFLAILGPIYSEYLKRNKHVKPAVYGELYRLPELGEYNDNE
jgi:DNA helicase HerA-like ATPase